MSDEELDGYAKIVSIVERASAIRAPGPHGSDMPADRRPAAPAFNFKLFDQIDPAPRKDWLVRGALGAGEFSVLYGDPGSGKSVFATDLAFAVASGTEWFGRAVKCGSVMYVAAERAKLTERRLAALRAKHELAEPKLAILEGRFDLFSSEDDARRLVATSDAICQATGSPVSLIIVDTVARVIPGADENHARDIGKFASNIDLIRQLTGAHVLAVHHAGKDETKKMRGSTAFRAKHRLQFSTAPTLLPLNEHGEFQSGAMAEAQESYSVATFGRIIGFTRQAMVNDDLGAFADVSRRMGQASAAFEAGFLANLVASNPAMSDGNALFSAAHGNNNPSASGMGPAILPDSLSSSRQAMRMQTGLLGEPIAVTPKYILCGADRETEAEKAVSVIQPVQSQNVNPFQNKLEVVVDPRISGDWYLVADPAEIDGLEYAYLEGAAGPQITSELGFDVDGARFRVRLDFGAGFVDWRGWYHNPPGEIIV